ncbi:hypothetical protein BRPE64_BCDS11870 [Caballeronia insecticola]|uniref:Uncharacterized protein n=1 Tax=Caballeronia insecticola TaxID=758793 RepID=R4WMK7_9BURK|nr:hypothetical protein BRPE64_BCDS11870 [Caballeronia insecticola]
MDRLGHVRSGVSDEFKRPSIAPRESQKIFRLLYAASHASGRLRACPV